MFGINVEGKSPAPPPPPPPPSAPAPAPAPRSSYQRPQLRGFLANALKLRLIGVAGLIVVAGGSVKLFRVNARRNRYREFYRYYDAKADFERMKNAGVFTSVTPDGSVGDL